MDYSDKFIRAFQHVQKWEGGPIVTGKEFDGHITKYGIIQETYGKYYPHKSVVDCTEEQAMMIYYEGFWQPCKCEQISNASLAEFVFQGAVNQGVYGFVRNCVQYAIGVVADGKIGPQTLGVLNNDARGCYDKIYKATKERYERIANNGKSKFLKGWLNRINDFKFRYNQ